MLLIVTHLTHRELMLMDCGEGRQSLHTLSVGAHAYGLWGGKAVITYTVSGSSCLWTVGREGSHYIHCQWELMLMDCGERVVRKAVIVLTFLYEIRRGGCGVEEIGSHAQYLREEASAGDVKWIPEAL